MLSEEEVVQWFSEARAASTGRRLTDIEKSERPDFLASCSKLGHVGIEITNAQPKQAVGDMLFELEFVRRGGDPLDAHDAVDMIWHSIDHKNTKRLTAGWTRPASTILVVQVLADLREVKRCFQRFKRSESVPPHGFLEIWLQDYELCFDKDGEPRAAAVLCLHPAYWWMRTMCGDGYRTGPFSTRG